MLLRRGLSARDTLHRAMAAAGGLYIMPAAADAAEVRREIVQHGIRAIEVQGSTLEPFRGLPLEFLVGIPSVPAEPIATLRRLRGLHLDHWTGHLDLDALPRLEWYVHTEIEAGQLEPLLGDGRPRLHHLQVGRYRFADATPLHRLTQLTHLSIGHTRRFTSLRGIEALPGLRYLTAYLCPMLESLSGIEEAAGLQHLELDRCNKVTDLTPVARLAGLRSIHLAMRDPPSLEPLADHPGLEYIWIVSAKRQPPALIDALLRSPRLRFLDIGRGSWLRTNGRWEHVSDIYAMTPDQAALRDRIIEERDAVAAW